jgi:hypothetical protein
VEAGHQWLTPVILATQEDRGLKSALANSSVRPYLKKIYHEKELVKWLKVEALSSNPSTAKKKKRKRNYQ